jgi:hypothetical protein
MIVGPCCCLSRHERGVRPTPYLCAPLERDAEAVKPFLTLDGRVASSHYGIVRNLPGGTVTFLFTDVEGSTRLLQELGDGYAEASGGGALVVRGEAGIWEVHAARGCCVTYARTGRDGGLRDGHPVRGEIRLRRVARAAASVSRDARPPAPTAAPRPRAWNAQINGTSTEAKGLRWTEASVK